MMLNLYFMDSVKSLLGVPYTYWNHSDITHALSSYKDHPYKDQVVHFRKNKDQY